ncbi:MAG TPA: SUMF1/EgtB/PvdO family nonheme iron enzyme [Terriglobales bacterium]|nr:SUMF1/EgtB/PvdO family nonheme iron enzyme [Terriglobales bacterium]
MHRWFLSYNSQDVRLAEALEGQLQRQDLGATIFFAPKSLRPGAYWMPRLADEIAQATGCIFLFGPNGPGPWQRVEYDAAFARQVKDRDFPVIPVLLDGQPLPGLPFLGNLHWVATADPGSESCVAQILAAAADGGAPAGELWRHTAPYRGLAAMTEADADFFFGRGGETADAIGVLASVPNKLVLLLGNSGVGKSSLAQAGIIAALMQQAWPEADLPTEPWPRSLNESRSWCFLKLRPGTDPVRALVEPFLHIWQFEPDDPVRGRLLSDWTINLTRGSIGLRDVIDATEAHYRNELKEAPPPVYLLYIDQGEELYLRAARQQRDRFSELIATGLRDPRLRAMMSLRADFFGELQKDEALHSVHRLIDVPPLREAAVRTIVERPASLLRARFEGVHLSSDIARRAAEDSVIDTGALPLLSYLLDEMWTRMVERGDGVLRLPAQAIDPGHVLVERGETFIAAHLDREAMLKRILTLKLATVREDGLLARRRAFRSEFSHDEWLLIDELTDHPNRLVITGCDGGEVYAEIAHETVFQRWDTVRKWVAETRDFLIWKSALETDRRAWSVAPARVKSSALLVGLKLAQAREWLRSHAADLPQAESDFIALSQRAAQWRRVRLWSMVAAAPVVVGLLLVGIWAGFVWQGVREVENEWAAKRVFVRIPAGCFAMGSPPEERGHGPDEEPVHEVCLDGFDLSKFAVTQSEWRRVMVGIMGFPSNPEPSHRKFPNNPDHLDQKNDLLPVDSVSWDDIQTFIRLMNVFGQNRYRLPSESEWEYAARAGTTSPWYWGDREQYICVFENVADQSFKKARPGSTRVVASLIADCDDGYSEAAPVGFSQRPNPWGLYDMLGNVAQWVEDCFVPNYASALDSGKPLEIRKCDDRVIRGGSWYDPPVSARAASRAHERPAWRAPYYGFRVVKIIASSPR